MDLNGKIKKMQKLSGQLVKSSGGGSVQEIYWVKTGVSTATNAEVNAAVADNKLPIAYTETTNAYNQPVKYQYFLIQHTPTEAFFAGVDRVNKTIQIKRLYADAWSTEFIHFQEQLTWDQIPRVGSTNPVTSGGIYNALQNVSVAVDSELSTTSEAPVQNKVITEALATKADQSSVESTIPPIVNTWLGNNVAQETGYVLDNTLTMSNAAAPASAVGDLKSALISSAGQVEVVGEDDFVYGKYIATNGEIGTVVDLTPVPGGYSYYIAKCYKGDIIVLTGTGGNAPRLWAETDENFRLVAAAGPAETQTDFTYQMTGDGYIIVNALVSAAHGLTVTRFAQVNDNIEYVNSVFGDNSESIHYDFHQNKYINTAVGVGNIVDVSPISNVGTCCAVIPVEKYNVVTLTGTGGGNARLWCVTDQSYKVIRCALPNAAETNFTIEATEKGYVIVNFVGSLPYKLSARRITNPNYFNELPASKYLIGILNTGDAGTTVDVGNPTTWQNVWRYCIVPVKAGEIYRVSGFGGNAARLWALTDQNYVIQESAQARLTANVELVVQMDGYLICNLLVSYGYSVKKYENYTDLTNKVLALVNKSISTPAQAPAMPDYRGVLSTVPYNRTAKMSVQEIYDAYDALVTAYPNYCAKEVLGNDSSGDYDVVKYTFTPEIPLTYPTYFKPNIVSGTDYPTVIMDACIHGNEYPCAMALLNFMTLVAQSTSGIYSWLKNNVRFVIIPIACPIGYANETRWNANHVNLARNFGTFWSNGDSDPESADYRGSAPLSEPESQYIQAVLEGNRDAILYYNWHTHGVFTSYAYMTSFHYFGTLDVMQRVGYDVVKSITDNGHAAHDVPLDSGFIGRLEISNFIANSANAAMELGIVSATPEVMYRIYGTNDPYLTPKVNCLNAEYITIAVASAIKCLTE